MQPKWLKQAFLHRDIIRRAEKEGAGHQLYTRAELREAIIHTREEMTIIVSLMTTACKLLSKILTALCFLAILFIAFCVWRITL